MAIKVLLIGLGQIGMGYDLRHINDINKTYTHASAFHLHAGFSLIAATDADEKKCHVFEKTYQSPAYTSLEIALSHHMPDLIIVAIPTEYHCDTIQKILKLSEPKAILCEKPLSYSLDEATLMVDLCKNRNVSLYVNYMRRSDPGVIQIKKMFDEGEISLPVKGSNWYSKGIQHNGSHFLNLLEFWLGSLTDVQIIDRGRLWNNSDPEPDMRLIFDRGTVVMLAAWEEKFSHYDIELLTANGRIRYGQGGQFIHWHRVESDDNFDGYNKLSPDAETILSGMERYQWHVTEQLALAFQGEVFHLCTGFEALVTQKNIQSIIEAVTYDE